MELLITSFFPFFLAMIMPVRPYAKLFPVPVPPWQTHTVVPGVGVPAFVPGSGQRDNVLATSAIINRCAGRVRKLGMADEIAASFSRISCLVDSVSMARVEWH